MARRTIGKPRFYCDIPSYLKTIGKYHGVTTSGMVDVSIPNMEKVFTMNPYQVESYDGGYTHHWSDFKFFINQDPVSFSSQAYVQQKELKKLLAFHTTVPADDPDQHHSSGWYAGILGHNFASRGVASISQRFIGMDEDGLSVKYSNQTEFREIVNFKDGIELENVGDTGVAEYDGYSLWEITSKNTGHDRFNILSFYITKHDGTNWLDWGEDDLKIGAYTCGIFFEPEHSFDLKGSVTYSQEGFKTQTTAGGSTLSNINYLGVPNWGDQPAWTLQKTDGRDYTTVSNRGRRQWKVGLSFVTDDGMMDKAGNSNKFYNDGFDDIDGSEDAYSLDNFDTSMSSFFKLSNMGKLPFIFCPDSTADDLEFAICRITNKPSFKQVANNLFSTSLTITETW